jgi:glycosyltransferase involved in cell wall biosynthesis
MLAVVASNTLREAMIFVYPSLAESGEALGLAPIEAMGQGAVPIVSALSCFSDFVVEGQTGCVFDHRSDRNIIALADLIEDLVSDVDKREKIRRQALHVAQRYELQTVAKTHVKSFFDLEDSHTDRL